MIGDYTIDYLIERAHKKIDRRTLDWDVLNDALDVPKLDRSEIVIGRELGEGGFFKVHEIQKIVLLDDGEDDTETEAAAVDATEIEELATIARTQSEDLGVIQNRRYMQKHCVRVGRNGKRDCRYALKSMKKGALSDPGLFVNTLVDLAIEARFLCSIKHPNILKMRGISTDFIDAGANSFIILDRLYQTLTDKIAYWKDRKDNGFVNFFDFRGKKQRAFLAERITVGFDIANALEYLHDRRYVT
jgi:serine/threonine protein kinase